MVENQRLVEAPAVGDLAGARTGEPLSLRVCSAASAILSFVPTGPVKCP